MDWTCQKARESYMKYISQIIMKKIFLDSIATSLIAEFLGPRGADTWVKHVKDYKKEMVNETS